ncbi:hypothetical protein RRSWK_05361 [Rhodopirellula sp. SWK7]|nr:hypothetical protein RRSWK_05361 [Rhodopirellula sp. SWK7]
MRFSEVVEVARIQSCCERSRHVFKYASHSLAATNTLASDAVKAACTREHALVSPAVKAA